MYGFKSHLCLHAIDKAWNEQKATTGNICYSG